MTQRAGGSTGTYAIQVGGDGAVGVDDGLLAAQLDKLPDDGHVPADVVFEIGRGGTGCRVVVHSRFCVALLCSDAARYNRFC